MKRVVVSVINDLVTDQRVKKVCNYLHNKNFEVVLIGRKQRTSPEMDVRPYTCVRMKLLFEKGPLFYAEYTIRLFFKLLFIRADLFLSNDLDTLLPNFLVSKLKRKALIYDSHEYFTETPELVNRKFVQQVWKRIEVMLFPRLQYIITVNKSIADLYEKEYGKKLAVVRNIPPKSKEVQTLTRKELGLPDDKKLIILQGSGINIDRGGEEAVEAMRYLSNHLLLIVGGGDVIDTLKQNVVDFGIEDRVLFYPRMPYEKMMQYTMVSDLGITFDKDTNINYRFSLPNKLFDYIRAGIPVLSSDLVEIAKIIRKYDVGDFIENHEPKHIAKKIETMLADEKQLKRRKSALKLAANELCWENEEKVLDVIYGKFN